MAGRENSGFGRRWRNRLAGVLDLPRDVLIDLPKVTLVGTVQVTVENHRGLIEFTPQRVRIAAKEGAVEVEGERLTLRLVLPEEIILEGQVRTVSFFS
ncbi:MAG: sporulation protein YqfC [Clostridia bacterium]|nr:sporulation protein YqfC [Clostridia bacterium]MDH7573640.1 sporulation protein YqfC [Clostridia bacterium]